MSLTAIPSSTFSNPVAFRSLTIVSNSIHDMQITPIVPNIAKSIRSQVQTLCSGDEIVLRLPWPTTSKCQLQYSFEFCYTDEKHGTLNTQVLNLESEADFHKIIGFEVDDNLMDRTLNFTLTKAKEQVVVKTFNTNEASKKKFTTEYAQPLYQFEPEPLEENGPWKIASRVLEDRSDLSHLVIESADGTSTSNSLVASSVNDSTLLDNEFECQRLKSLHEEQATLNPQSWDIEHLLVSARQEATRDHPSTVTTESSEELCEDECRYLDDRYKIALNGLVKYLKVPMADARTRRPRFAVAVGGGGYRAMIATMAWISMAETNGLLDCLSHISTSSCATWAIAHWYSKDWSAVEAFEDLKGRISVELRQPLTLETGLGEIIAACTEKLLDNKPWELSDFTAGHLSAHFLSTSLLDPRRDVLSNLGSNSGRPLPIFNAMSGLTLEQRKAIDFTPFRVSCYETRASIPTWAIGTTLVEKGRTTEPSLASMMALWGSMYNEDIAKSYVLSSRPQTTHQLHLPDFFHQRLRKLVDESGKKLPSYSPSFFSNFDASSSSAPTIAMFDAFIEAKLSCVEPLLVKERRVEAIFVLDCGVPLTSDENDHECPELAKLEARAIKLGLPFPSIDYDKASKQLVSIFEDDRCPTIIYMPLKKHPAHSEITDVQWEAMRGGFSSTFRTKCEVENTEQIVALMERNFLDAQQNIKDALVRTFCKR